MKKTRSACLLGLFIYTVMGCTVVSKEVKEAALAPIPLPVLINDVQKYIGDTVVIGGHVVEVENKTHHTEIVVVQAPLGVGQRPKSKDLTQGRLVAIYNGFIDPEVYTKEREITIGGKVIGSSAQVENPAYPFLKLEVLEIHLWAVEEPPDPYWDDYGYPFPHRWWWHRHHRHHYWYD